MSHNFMDACKVREQTPIGAVDLISWGDALVMFNPSPTYNDPGSSLTINGVAYHVRLDLKKQPDGSFAATDYQSLIINRIGTTKVYDYSRSAYDKAKQILTTFANDYCQKHPEFVTKGAIVRLNNEAVRLESEIDKAEQARNEAENKLTTVQLELAALKGQLIAEEVPA